MHIPIPLKSMHPRRGGLMEGMPVPMHRHGVLTYMPVPMHRQGVLTYMPVPMHRQGVLTSQLARSQQAARNACGGH